MREVIFRGKQIRDGQWVEGNLFVDDKGEKCEILIGYTNYRIAYEVDPETIGQWTGLVDKNGVKIFEGDMVVPTNRRRLANKASVVEYDPLSGYWMCNPAREPLVIGSIHDKAVEECNTSET